MDNALSLAIERYVSPEAAMAYDALSTILAPDPTDIVRGGKWEIKILAKRTMTGGREVFVECKRDLGRLSHDQLLKEAEYAHLQGVNKIIVYYSRDSGRNYGLIQAIKEAKKKYCVDVELRYYASSFK